MPHRRKTPARSAAWRLALLAGLPLLAAAGAARADDYPTVERVLFVQECMRAHPGAYFEMVNKCSCAIDALARELPFDDYTTLSTITNAMSIGGERGSVLRDNEALPAQARRFRDLQAKAKRACFIKVDAPAAPR